MPKKKKTKPVDRDDSELEKGSRSSVKQDRSSGGKASSGDGMISPDDADSKEEIRMQELRYLQDMFEGKLDPVVVHMIMNDCDFKVEAALETLFKLVDQTTAFESGMFRLSGFKDVYIPKTEMEEDTEADCGEDSNEESPFPDRADLRVRQPQTRNTQRFENCGNRELPHPNLRNVDDDESESAQLYTKDAASSPMVTRQGVLSENDPSESMGETQDALSGQTVVARGPNNPFNDLSKTETSRDVKSSRVIGFESDLLPELKITESSSNNMNIHHDAALPRSQTANAGSHGIRKTPQRPGSSNRSQDRLSSFRKTDPNLGGDISTSEVRTTWHDPPSTSADTDVGGSSPVNPASDDFEKLLIEMKMHPDMVSASTENVEPSVIENQDEYLNCPFNAGQCTINPDVTRNEIDSDQQNKISASHNIETESSDHQPSQIRMEGETDRPQQNRGAASPDFFPKSYTRYPWPGPSGSQYPPSGFPPRFHNRMPRPKSVGRASVLQRHLRPHDPQVSRPFFTPIPRGADPRRESPTHRPEHPVQNFQPPRFTRTDGSFRQPNSKPQSTVPPWLQKQEQSQHKFPTFSNPKYQPFGQRSISPVHGPNLEGVKPPPDGLNTSSSHKGVVPPVPKWPVSKHTNHTPRVQAHGKRRSGFEDKVVPLPEGKVLCLMRGCPGSGKSTLARKLVGQGRVLSSDDYFITNGEYHFDVTKLSDAHDWSHKGCQDAMKSGVTPIIIDNTNIERWTMKPYVVMALQYGYTVEFREPTTPWKFNLGKLYKNNTHNVPRDRIRLMIERFERNVSVENILGSSKPQKLKAFKRDRYMYSPRKERRMYEQEEEYIQVDGVSSDEFVREGERMTWRKHKEEDDGIIDYKEGEGVFSERYQTTVEETPTPVAKALDADEELEEIQSDDEMFVSDTENGIDAMMESLAEFSEVNETPLRDEEPVITSEVVASCDLSRSCEDGPSASKKNDIKEDEQKKVDFIATEDLVAAASPLPCQEDTQGVFRDEERIESIGDDDFVAVVNLEAGASCVPLHVKTHEGGSRDDNKIKSIVDDDFEAVINSITQASWQPTIKLLSTNQNSSPAADQEEVIVENKEENLDNEDEFVKMMNLEVGGSSVQYVDKDINEKHQDDSGKDEDNFKTETTLVQDISCSPNEQPDNIGKDQKMEDDAAMIALIQEASLDPSEGQTRPQDSPNEAEDKKEDDDDFTAMMNEVAEATFQLSHELTDIEEQENLEEQPDNIGKEFTLNSAMEDLTMVTADGQKLVADIHDLGSPESEPNPNPESPNLKIDSAVQDSTDGDENFELITEKCSVEDEVTEEGGESEPSETGNDCSYFKELNKDEQTTQMSQTQDQTSASKQKNHDATGEKMRPPTQEFMNDNFQVAISLSERQLETSLSESNMFIGDINSNLMGGVIKQGEGVTDSRAVYVKTTSPSCLSHHELYNQQAIPVSTQSTPSPSLTPRSQSPMLKMSPLSHDENAAQHCHEKRKLRRSKSHGKGTRMAAVFPKLPPGTVNWLELAGSVEKLEGEMTPEKPLISSVDLTGISFTDVGTNTLAADFSCLQRLGSGKLTVEDVQCQGFVVVTGQARQLSVLNQSDVTTTNENNSQHDSESLALNSSQDRSPIPASVTLHKSTMTDHKSENIDDNLANLITLFPSFPQNDLEDILARCTGDLEWATNILLDDLGNGERGEPKQPDLGKAGGSVNPNKQEVVSSGSATNHLDDKEEQEMTLNQECLQSKRDFHTSNLASSMISVVDDILKSISSENIESATSSTPLEKASSHENGKRESTVTVQYSEKIDDLFRELDPKNLNVDFTEAHQDSTGTIGSRNSTSEQELLQVHERSLQHDKDTTVKMNISKKEEQTLSEIDFTGEKPEANTVLEGPDLMDTQVSTGGSSKTTPDEDKNQLDINNILEGSTLEAVYTVEHQQLDKPLDQIEPSSTVPEVKQDFFQNTVNDFRQSPECDRPKEQVVRPKTPSRSASKRPSNKLSRREGSDADLHERMKRDPSRAAAPLRMDAFEAAGGVQFSWNHQSEAEFSVPRPEQMMTGYGKP